MKTTPSQTIKRRSYRPGDGTRVFAVRFAYPGARPQWESCGAADARDAGEFVAEANSAVGGQRPEVLKVVELFYSPVSHLWEPRA